MRKLLFSLSLAVCLFGCSETKTESKNSAVEEQPSSSDMPIDGNEESDIQDKPQVLRSEAPEVQEAGKASPQTATPIEDGHKEMPVHGSPDQLKIDSIKAAKQKGKK